MSHCAYTYLCSSKQSSTRMTVQSLPPLNATHSSSKLVNTREDGYKMGAQWWLQGVQHCCWVSALLIGLKGVSPKIEIGNLQCTCIPPKPFPCTSKFLQVSDKAYAERCSPFYPASASIATLSHPWIRSDTVQHEHDIIMYPIKKQFFLNLNAQLSMSKECCHTHLQLKYRIYYQQL